LSGDVRIRLVQPIEVDFFAESFRGEGRVQNVSREGLFVRTPLLPPDGIRVTVVFEPESRRKIAVDGIVRWNTAPLRGPSTASGFGVRLTRFSDDYIRFVDGAIAAGQQPEGWRD
jgi:hypothetical protein